MAWCSSGAMTLPACWPRSSAASCGWLADHSPVQQRQPFAQALRQRLDDCRARLVPEGRKEQQCRPDDERGERDVQLDGAELPEQFVQRIKHVGERRDEKGA